MSKFRRKPVVIEARQLTPGDLAPWKEWLGDSFAGWDIDGIAIRIRGIILRANIGDWIICSAANEFFPCSDELFRKIYDPVCEDAA